MPHGCACVLVKPSCAHVFPAPSASTHVRDRDCVAPLMEHVIEHAVQEDHEPQVQSTEGTAVVVVVAPVDVQPGVAQGVQVGPPLHLPSCPEDVVHPTPAGIYGQACPVLT